MKNRKKTDGGGRLKAGLRTWGSEQYIEGLILSHQNCSIGGPKCKGY